MIKKILLFILAIFLVAVIRFTYPLVYQVFIDSDNVPASTTVKVMAHRGASGYAPENTLASFQKALELHVDIIEFDVHLTKDNQLIIIHDSELSRTTNMKGAVHDYTLAELRQADAGCWFGPEFSKEKLPTLGEVLALINGQTYCIIELKWDHDEGYYTGLSALTAKEIEKVNGYDWCTVQSFESRYLDELHVINPNIKLVKAMIGAWPSPIFGFYYDIGFHWGKYRVPEYLWAINVYYKTITKAQVNTWHQNGARVWTYTINDPDQMRQQINIGVDGVLTNYPNKLAAIIGRPEK